MQKFLLLSGLVATAVMLGARASAEPARTFAPCTSGTRVTCVVDGDTFWLSGEKIRIADINAPETGHPGCAGEAALGMAATRRLTDLLNAGGFTLQPWPGRDRDRYGRALRVVIRGRQSIGAVLVAEGLAEYWTGRRRDWCTAAG